MGWESKTKHAAYAVNPSTPTAESPPCEPDEEQVDDAPSMVEQATGQQEVDSQRSPQWRDVALPVPDAPEVGNAAGAPVLVGGADLIDSSATLVAYASSNDADDPRELLFTTVAEDAEPKLLEAVATSAPTQAVQVAKQVTERSPLDLKHKLLEHLVSAAKSINAHMKQGDSPWEVESCLTKFKASRHAVEEASSEATQAGATGNQEMLDHYQEHLKTIADRMNGANASAYDSGGKIPPITEYLRTHTVTVVEDQPVPVDGLLPTATRQASRPAPSIDPETGHASWDGVARSHADGKEYVIDLGDGYTGVYRPYGLNDPASHEYSLRGQLEVHAPPGAGHGHHLIHKLGELNLVNRPLTHAEGEWAYLQANLTAQGLAKKPKVKAALKSADSMETFELQEIFHARAHEAIGLDQPELHKLAKQFQLEAAASCLPKKVRLVRNAIAAYTGHGGGNALAASAGYDPTPKTSGGWLTWNRFDVTDNGGPTSSWNEKSLTHRVNGHNLAKMLTSGVLASTERRALMGLHSGLGQSEEADKYSGGANSVFLRVKHTKDSISGPMLVWDDPARLLSRADYYAYGSDHYGSINPANSKTSTGLTRDPTTIAGFADHEGNEIMFRNGIDLLGGEAPSRIICSSAAEREKLLALLGGKGISTLAGKPVTDVVVLGKGTT